MTSSLHDLLVYSQAAVSNAVYAEIKRELPISMADLVTVTKRYGIQVRFVPKGKPCYGAANCDFNRWTCSTNVDQVVSISVG